MERDSEKEWYFGNKEKERLGPYSFNEVICFFEWEISLKAEMMGFKKLKNRELEDSLMCSKQKYWSMGQLTYA